jgi:hypothetical protein
MNLSVPFRLRGLDGEISVDVRPCRRPEESGLMLLDEKLPRDAGLGLPLCTATVSYPGQGYSGAMGWVQLVRSTDGGDPNEHEPDPLALLRDANTPYAFFGIRPTLFDAPYRPLAPDVRWQARSYLAVTPDAVMTRAAQPIAAFSWGFAISAGHITIDEPERLPTETWAEHAPMLGRAYPGWAF